MEYDVNIVSSEKIVFDKIVDACEKSTKGKVYDRYRFLDIDAQGHIIKINISFSMGTLNYHEYSHNTEELLSWTENKFILPEEIGKLYYLEELDLSCNNIFDLPVNIIKLENLKKLNISRTKICKFPNEMYKMKNLEYIKASQTYIMDLPEDFNRMPKLRYMFLRRSRLNKFPLSIIGIKSLKILDIYWNNIDDRDVIEGINKVCDYTSVVLCHSEMRCRETNNGDKCEIYVDKSVFDYLDKLKREQTFFISYCRKDSQIADMIDYYFKDYNVTIKRDIRDINNWESIKQFMQGIRDQDYVILVISSDYLKSANCMYEVLEIMKNRDFEKRIFPIVIERKIYNPIERIEFVEFWDKKCKEIEEKIKTIPLSCSEEIIHELKKCAKISLSINEFMTLIADMNNPNIESVCSAIVEMINRNGIIIEQW